MGWHSDAWRSIDLPALLRFRLRLTPTDAGSLTYDIPPGNGPTRLELEIATDELRGVVHEHHASGSMRLWRETAFDRASFEPNIGVYRSGDGRELFLSVRGDGDAAIPFYLDGDDVVRLYPTGANTFVSERGKHVSTTSDRRIEISAHPTAQPRTWRRSEPYATCAVTFDSDGRNLGGSLYMPHGAGPFPGVVLLHGSSPGERDFYRIYAHHFARNGIAALVYDRAGSGHSSGPPASTLEQRARDAAAGLHFLRGRSEIDPARVGVWAFSNGTWSAPMLAGRDDEHVAFLLVNGAAGVSGAESEVHRKLTELRGWGVAAELLADAERCWRAVYACMTFGAWPDIGDAEFDALVARLHAEPSIAAIPLAHYAVQNPWLAPVPPRIPARTLQAEYAGRVPDLAYDPVPDYERMSCPVSFQVGSDDPNTPGELGAQRVREALRRARNTKSSVEVIAGAAHYLNVTPPTVEGMSAAEAAAELHGFRFVPGYLENLSRWVLSLFD